MTSRRGVLMAWSTSVSPIGDHSCVPPTVCPAAKSREVTEATRSNRVVLMILGPPTLATALSARRGSTSTSCISCHTLTWPVRAVCGPPLLRHGGRGARRRRSPPYGLAADSFQEERRACQRTTPNPPQNYSKPAQPPSQSLPRLSPHASPS